MPTLRPIRWLAITVALLLLAACDRNPQVVKRKYLENGNRYFDKGRFREARILYLTALKQDPKYGEAYYRLGLAEIRLSKPAAAIAPCRRAVELLPESPERNDARTILADLYLATLETWRLQRSVIDDTKVLADELLKLNPSSYAGHRIKGTLAMIQAEDLLTKRPIEGRNQLDVAIAELSKANSLRSLQPQVVIRLAQCFEFSGRPSDAEMLLLRAIDGDKTLMGAYRQLHRHYVAVKRFEDAEQILDRAIRNNPNQYSVLVELASYYESRGKTNDAEKTLQVLLAHAKEFPLAYERAGEFYSAFGKSDQAILVYEKGIAAFPKEKLKYQTRIADVLLAEGKSAEAKIIDDAILKENPNDVPTMARASSILRERGELKGAITMLNAALKIDPNSSLARYELGRAFIANKQPELARYQLSEAIQWSPHFAAARLALAQIEMETGEYSKAVSEADEILASNRRDSRAHLIRATAFRLMRKYDESRVELSMLLHAKPLDTHALFQLGALEAVLGKSKEADHAFLASYKADPRNIRSLRALVSLQLERHEFDQTLTILRAEVQRFPERVDLRMLLAECASRVGRPDIAEAELEQAIRKTDPKSMASAEQHRRLGESQLLRGDLTAAQPHLELAHQLQPGNATTLCDLGLVYARQKRPKEALAAYTESVKLDGRNTRTMNNLAYLMAESGGDLDQALTLAQRALQIAPKNLEIADTMGLIYLKKNLPDNGLTIFEDILRNRPTEAVFRYHLALALLQKGDMARAKRELQKTLANGPSPSDAAKIHAQLDALPR